MGKGTKINEEVKCSSFLDIVAKKKKERKKEKKNLLTIKKITLEYNQHRTAFQCRQVFSHRLCWFCFVFQRSVIGTVTAVQNSCTAFLQSCEIAEVPWPYFQFFPSLCTNKRKKERKKKKANQKNKPPKTQHNSTNQKAHLDQRKL